MIALQSVSYILICQNHTADIHFYPLILVSAKLVNIKVSMLVHCLVSEVTLAFQFHILTAAIYATCIFVTILVDV